MEYLGSCLCKGIKFKVIGDFESLVAADNYFSQSLKELKAQIKKTDDKTTKDSLHTLIQNMYESGEAFTPEASDLEKRGEELSLAFRKWGINYPKENISIMSFSLLIENMNRAVDNYTEDIPKCIELFDSVY